MPRGTPHPTAGTSGHTPTAGAATGVVTRAGIGVVYDGTAGVRGRCRVGGGAARHDVALLGCGRRGRRRGRGHGPAGEPRACRLRGDDRADAGRRQRGRRPTLRPGCCRAHRLPAHLAAHRARARPARRCGRRALSARPHAGQRRCTGAGIVVRRPAQPAAAGHRRGRAHGTAAAQLGTALRRSLATLPEADAELSGIAATLGELRAADPVTRARVGALLTEIVALATPKRRR